ASMRHCRGLGDGAVMSIFLAAWVSLFSSDPAVLAAGSGYLRAVGPPHPFLAIVFALSFACQGSGKVLLQVLARTVQLVIVIGGGFVLLAAGTGLQAIFVLIAVGMVIFGTLSALAVARTSWGERYGFSPLRASAKSAMTVATTIARTRPALVNHWRSSSIGITSSTARMPSSASASTASTPIARNIAGSPPLDSGSFGFILLPPSTLATRAPE